jgi:hypothetical protein
MRIRILNCDKFIRDCAAILMICTILLLSVDFWKKALYNVRVGQRNKICINHIIIKWREKRMKNMMKKIVCGAAALATLVTSAAFCKNDNLVSNALGEGFFSGSYNANLGGWVITSVSPQTRIFRVPAYFRGKPVKRVNVNAFMKCNNLQLVIIDGNDTEFDCSEIPNSANCKIMWNARNTHKYNENTMHHHFRLGDTNNDNQVDILDVQNILKTASTDSWLYCSDWYKKLAQMDVDLDGKLTEEDAQYALRYYVETAVSHKHNMTFEEYMHQFPLSNGFSS